MALTGCLTTDGKTPSTRASAPLTYLPALAGDYFKHHSRIVGRDYHIYVRLPADYEQQTTHRYPVVYVLDGDSLFPILAANHVFLNFDEGLPEAVIVGIAYGSFARPINQRGVDFSTVQEDGQPGGAAAFQEFLQKELLPQVESRYRIDTTRRVLFGQSRSGHFVLFSAFTAPDLFWGRIASNPAFDPGRERFFAAPESSLRNDLGLVVTSGSRDRAPYRQHALEWFAAAESRTGYPWQLLTTTLEGGTHAANSADSYRIGMLWLFRERRVE